MTHQTLEVARFFRWMLPNHTSGRRWNVVQESVSISRTRPGCQLSSHFSCARARVWREQSNIRNVLLPGFWYKLESFAELVDGALAAKNDFPGEHLANNQRRAPNVNSRVVTVQPTQKFRRPVISSHDVCSLCHVRVVGSTTREPEVANHLFIHHA